MYGRTFLFAYVQQLTSLLQIDLFINVNRIHLSGSLLTEAKLTNCLVSKCSVPFLCHRK